MSTLSILLKQATLTPVQQEYVNTLGKSLLYGGGAGAGVGLLMKLPEVMRQHLGSPEEQPEPTVINIPYQQGVPGQEPDKKRSKYAGLGNLLFPDDAKSVMDMPGTPPTIALGAGGAAFGGLALTKHILDNHLAKARDAEVDDAKDKYNQAMLAQFKPIPAKRIAHAKLHEPAVDKLGSAKLDAHTIKTLIEKTASSDSKLASISDKLDQLSEKAAEWYNPLSYRFGGPNGDAMSVGSGMGGAYATLATALGLGAGTGVYHYTKANDPKRQEADALKKQYDERWANKPSEMYAHLVPVDEKGRPAKPLPKQTTDIESQFKEASNATSNDVETMAATFVRDLFGE